MALIFSWILSGAIFGSVGTAAIASALVNDGPRGGVNLDKVFFWLLVTTVIGAVGGGLLARLVRRRYANDARRLAQFALLPALPAAILLLYSISRS